MIRAVIDTNVLVSAFIGRRVSAPGRVVQLCREGRLTLVASPQLITELEGVLARPKFHRWSQDDRASAYAAGLAAIAEMHTDPERPPTVTADPKDDYLVALAVASAADLLTSGDRHLLDAQLDIDVLTPAQLLERHR